MSNNYFQFKQFIVYQEKSAFKVGTDGVLLGAYMHLLKARTILDVGTGTGLIALMAAQRSDAIVYAIEPDEESFEQAQENVSKSPWSQRIHLYNCTLQDFQPDLRFDLIVANPPFFSNSLKNPNVRLANARHNDCLPFDVLLQRSLSLLSESGELQVIIPWCDITSFTDKAGILSLFCDEVLSVRPRQGSKPVRAILHFTREKTTTVRSELSIETTERHHYTDEYMELTRDFYINF